MKKLNFGTRMQDAANKAINEDGIRVRTQVRDFYERQRPGAAVDYLGMIGDLLRTQYDPTVPHPDSEPPLQNAAWRRPGTSQDALDRLVVRPAMRLVETTKPYLETYHGPEVHRKAQEAFERQQKEMSESASRLFKRSTPGDKVVVDLTQGDIAKVRILDQWGKYIADDYFYKTHVRSESEYEYARTTSLRGMLKDDVREQTKIKRTESEIRGAVKQNEKMIRHMRFIERFCSGETRYDIAKVEKITHQRVMDIIDDGVRFLWRRYKDEISFIEPHGEQGHDMAEYNYGSAFMWPSGGKQVMENKDVLLVFARRYYDEHLRPYQQQLKKEEEELLHV